jgi:ketosteroid isomerase-like protein
MSAHTELIQRFYEALRKGDGASMAASYHPEARFSDPVFPDLDARHVRGMWRMFTEKGGVDVIASNVQASGDRGLAHWDARYNFSATGRPVLNRIDAQFEFKDGKIFRHKDHFDFWKWSRQALGTKGALLGWTPIVRGAVQKRAARNLAAFLERSPG